MSHAIPLLPTFQYSPISLKVKPNPFKDPGQCASTMLYYASHLTSYHSVLGSLPSNRKELLGPGTLSPQSLYTCCALSGILSSTYPHGSLFTSLILYQCYRLSELIPTFLLLKIVTSHLGTTYPFWLLTFYL